MRIRRFLVSCFVLTAVTPALVCAQDTRKVGITMAYPASFGVLWHTSSKMAIRPEIAFSGTSSETTSTVANQSISNEADGWGIGTGVSAIFYLRTYEHLRTYVSPRFSYTYGSSTSSIASTITGALPTSGTQTTKGIGGFGSFGAQYMLGDRFSVFGEVGFGVVHSTTDSSAVTAISASGNAWGTRAGVGVVFYP